MFHSAKNRERLARIEQERRESELKALLFATEKQIRERHERVFIRATDPLRVISKEDFEQREKDLL